MQKLMKAMHRNEKGFTLVELMVVVVIIGILVAIAIPIYNNVQATARQNAHDANIRTIQGIIEVYKADNDGALPDQDDLVPGYILEWPDSPGTYTVEAGVLTATLPE